MVSQTLNPSQVMVQTVGASPAFRVPSDPAGVLVHCHSAPYSSSGGRILSTRNKMADFLLEGF